MLDLKELEKQRKEYQDILDNMKKIEGEEKGILAEKERIDKIIIDSGYKSIEELKVALNDMEVRITELKEKVTEKCKIQ